MVDRSGSYKRRFDAGDDKVAGQDSGGSDHH